MISFWSLFSATVWFSVVSLLLYALRQHTDFLMSYGATILSAVVALTIARMLLPLDSDHMIVVRSYTVLLALNTMLKHQVWGDVSVKLLLKWVWAFGAVLGVAFIIFGSLMDRWRLHRLFTVPMSPEMREIVEKSGIAADVVIRVTPEVSTPMVTGFFRPVVYLPAREYSEPDLLWILRHEISHYKCHDAWLRLGFLLFRCLFWWNPIVHIFQRFVDEILELRCDKAVLSEADHAGRLEYVKALGHVANQMCRNDPSYIGAGTFVPSAKTGGLATRARLAMEEPQPHGLKVLAVLAVSIVLFAASYIFILQPASFPADMEDGVEIYRSSSEISYLKALPSGDYELWCGGEFVGYIAENMRNDEAYKDLEVLP